MCLCQTVLFAFSEMCIIGFLAGSSEMSWGMGVGVYVWVGLGWVVGYTYIPKIVWLCGLR